MFRPCAALEFGGRRDLLATSPRLVVVTSSRLAWLCFDCQPAWKENMFSFRLNCMYKKFVCLFLFVCLTY